MQATAESQPFEPPAGVHNESPSAVAAEAIAEPGIQSRTKTFSSEKQALVGTAQGGSRSRYHSG